MEQLVTLFRVFPDATLAITHRDPIASIQSALVGVCYISRISRKVIRADEIATYWVDRYERLLKAYVRDRDRVPDAQVIDVTFDRLVAEPIKTVETIYDRAGLPFTADVRGVMSQFLAQNPRGRQHGQIVYDLRRDFRLEPDDVRQRFNSASTAFRFARKCPDKESGIDAKVQHQDHRMLRSVGWRPEEPAERASDHVLYSRGTTNSNLVVTPDGDVLVNTGVYERGTETSRALRIAAGTPTESPRHHPDAISLRPCRRLERIHGAGRRRRLRIAGCPVCARNGRRSRYYQPRACDSWARWSGPIRRESTSASRGTRRRHVFS